MRVGITDHAQTELDTVVYVEPPQRGSHLDAAQAFDEIEPTKTVNDLIASLAGTVSARTRLNRRPGAGSTANPNGDGWLILVERRPWRA